MLLESDNTSSSTSTFSDCSGLFSEGLVSLLSPAVAAMLVTLSYLDPLVSEASLRLQLRTEQESSWSLCGEEVTSPESVGGEEEDLSLCLGSMRGEEARTEYCMSRSSEQALGE